MSKASPNDWDNAAVARRLRILRQHIVGTSHGSKAIFAAKIGIEYKRWTNFERGSPLPRDMAIQVIRSIPGLTLDWLYLGRADGLPGQLQRELEEAGKIVTLSEAPGSASASGSSRKPITKSRA